VDITVVISKRAPNNIVSGNCRRNNEGDIQLAYMKWLVNMPPVTQGKSKMAGYGKQVLVRNAFLWFMSAIYLFAFSSLYIQIPG